MLKEELKKVNIEQYKHPFDGQGIILLDTKTKYFIKIAFGGGDCDELEEGCDEYMYIQMDRYNEDGEFEEDVDGGQLDFASADSVYSGYINDEILIRDCLEFVEVNEDDVIFISQYS